MNLVKCVILGDSGVGKTSLIYRFKNDGFSESLPATIFDTHTVCFLKDEDAAVFGVWEVSALDKYVNERSKFAYPHTDVFLLCFALDNPESLNSIARKWVPELWADSTQTMNVPTVLVGTKVDLIAKIPMSQIENVKTQIGAIDFCACSAKNTLGVCHVLQTALRYIEYR